LKSVIARLTWRVTAKGRWAMTSYRDFWLTTEDGLRLYVRDYCNGAGRFPVLCLHGLTRNSADFAELAELLAVNYRVLVMEQRGRGRSDYDPDPANYQLGTYVRDAFALLDRLELDRLALIGTSMGGLMSMTMAAMQPTRFRGLVLNDVGPVVEPAGLARIRGYVGRGGAVVDWDEAVRVTRANNEVAFPDLSDAEWLAFARQLFRENAHGRLEPAYDPAIAEPMTADATTAVPADLWPLFETLTTLPVLVVRGALSDILSADTSAEMARRHPGLELVEVPGRGHAPWLTEPAAVTALRGFLERL
jgi:pimeloyl-ACP methyl ester carboxylesterase